MKHLMVHYALQFEMTASAIIDKVQIMRCLKKMLMAINNVSPGGKHTNDGL